MGKISEQTLEQIAGANDIVEVIGSYFPLKRAGSAYRALCPFHQEKTPSFHVNPQRQWFHCFGCGASGSVFKFVMSYENVDFPTAAKRLAERAGIKIVEEELSPEDDRRFRLRKRLLALHHDAAEWFHRNLLKSNEAQAARDYLKNRGIGSEVARAWKIGYAPNEWRALGEWAKAEGYSDEELIQSGLVMLKENAAAENPNQTSNFKPQNFYDRFRDRVMFPICNDLGEVIAFSGRVLQSDAQAAKYVNSPETMLFTKGNVLFGLHKSKRALIEKNSAIVCEGQLDLITAFEAGVQNVVASQGTAFTEKQARTLKRFVEEVVLCFDADGAGAKATERSLPALLGAGLSVRVAEMAAGHDPDSLIREQGAEAFVERMAKARDFFDFQIDRYANAPEFLTPRGKAQFARKLAEFTGLITDPVLRGAVANSVATRLQLPLGDFLPMLVQNAAKPIPESATRTEDRTPISRNALDLLSMLALRDSAAREWIFEQQWDDVLSTIEGSGLLIKILRAELDPGDPASTAAFTAQLEDAEMAKVSKYLRERLPENATETGLPADSQEMAQAVWREIERRELEHRREAVKSRIREPNLSMGEVVDLQKQILDLQKRLTDIARPSPGAVES